MARNPPQRVRPARPGTHRVPIAMGDGCFNRRATRLPPRLQSFPHPLAPPSLRPSADDQRGPKAERRTLIADRSPRAQQKSPRQGGRREHGAGGASTGTAANARSLDGPQHRRRRQVSWLAAGSDSWQRPPLTVAGQRRFRTGLPLLNARDASRRERLHRASSLIPKPTSPHPHCQTVLQHSHSPDTTLLHQRTSTPTHQYTTIPPVRILVKTPDPRYSTLTMPRCSYTANVEPQRAHRTRHQAAPVAASRSLRHRHRTTTVSLIGGAGTTRFKSQPFRVHGPTLNFEP
jgi:hypothetical protein